MTRSTMTMSWAVGLVLVGVSASCGSDDMADQPTGAYCDLLCEVASTDCPEFVPRCEDDCAMAITDTVSGACEAALSAFLECSMSADDRLSTCGEEEFGTASPSCIEAGHDPGDKCGL